MESLEEAPKTPRSAKVIPTCTRGRIQGLPRRPLGGQIVQKHVSYEGRPQKLAFRRGVAKSGKWFQLYIHYFSRVAWTISQPGGRP